MSHISASVGDRGNWAEMVAHEYLRSTCLDLRYEPDGNVPPDFLLDGSVAIEVRTLNEHYFGTEPPVGLEQDDLRVQAMVAGELARVEKGGTNNSYWVAVHFRRPLGSRKEFGALRKSVRKVLSRYVRIEPPCVGDVEVTPAMTLRFRQTSAEKLWRFRWGGQTDGDAGGFLIGIYSKNIRHCIEEKTEAIERMRHRYPIWRLVLVDPRWPFDENEDRDEIAAVYRSVSAVHPWQRVSVLCGRHTRVVMEWNEQPTG